MVLIKKSPPALYSSPYPPFLKPVLQGTTIQIWVRPGAKKTTWAGQYRDALQLLVQAPPLEGAANKHCIDFLAGWFGIKKSEVVLLKGEKSRSKVFLLKGLAGEKCRELIPAPDQNLLK
ncbi:MAG: DUF167 domain-containing protein [Thermodesulfobacteriota bacterium]